MNIKHRMIVIFSGILIVILAGSSFFSFNVTREAVIQSGIENMKNSLTETAHRAMSLHARSKDMLLMALEFPQFEQYFSLSDTKRGNQYDDKQVIRNRSDPPPDTFFLHTM